ncbi:MAG: BLUF domain-containing protein, partial [Halieaceae bacterium]|nr:BLUF domain-containing protein [Halieaceae bacterium]
EDSFFQILEGGEDEVCELYETIAADPRHDRIEIVTEGPVESREFTEWQMAFIELDGQDYSALPGFSDILKNTPEAREFLRGLSRSKKLALLFSVMD